MICIGKVRRRKSRTARHRRVAPPVRGEISHSMDRDETRPVWSGQGPPRAEWSDEELLHQYQATGNPSAFEELVRRYERELFNYLCQYLGDPELAEDAFQATFLQVHRKCHQFDVARRFRPWLYAVATNKAIDAQRRNRRHRLVSLDQHSHLYTESPDSGCLMDLVEGQELDPEEHVELNERKEDVRQAVEQLPEALRQVLLLVYYQGLKYREAAEILRIPVGTVKSRLHSAIRRLERHLKFPQPQGHG